MRFQVCCLPVALWNSLNWWESFGLSIAICSGQFTVLQSILHNNRQTIISLTIIWCSIFVFVANVWKIAPQSAKKTLRNPRKFDLLNNVVWQLFNVVQTATMLHKMHENWTGKGVMVVCYAFLFYIFNEFILQHLELNNKSFIERSVCSIVGFFLLVYCILIRSMDSPNYSVTRKNVPWYYTLNHLIRYFVYAYSGLCVHRPLLQSLQCLIWGSLMTFVWSDETSRK